MVEEEGEMGVSGVEWLRWETGVNSCET